MSNDLWSLGIKEELKLATILRVSPVSLPTVILPSILTLPVTYKLDAEISPYNFNEPVFGSFNDNNLIGVPEVYWCTNCFISV